MKLRFEQIIMPFLLAWLPTVISVETAGERKIDHFALT
jgi:hypothetical protein